MKLLSLKKINIEKSRILDLIIVLTLIFAVIIINLVMIRDGLNGMTDMKWHVTWLQHFYQQLTAGIWYPRWLAGTNYGYGSPTFVFYPPLVYYLGSGFKIVGLSTEKTITLLFSLALFLSGFNFYLFGSKVWGKLPSVIGALFYMSTPYLAFDIYYRSGLASIFVQAWIPLLFFTTGQTLTKPKLSSIGLAISWCLIALTHTPSLLLCSIVYSFYLILLLTQKGWKHITNLTVATFCGWGIASIYLIPAILEKSFVNISSLKEVHGGFRDALIGTSLPLFPLDLQNLVNVPYIFAHQSIAILILSAIALLGIKNHKFLKNSIFIWLTIAVILIFLMTGLSQFVWESSEILQMVQFPWRFLQFFSFIGAIMCTLAIRTIANVKLPFKIIGSLIILVFLLANYRYWHQLSRQFITINYSGKGNTEHLNHIKKALNSPYNDNLRDVPEYRPLLEKAIDNPPQPIIGQPKLSLLRGKATIELQTWHSYLRQFTVDTKTTSTIRIRTYYYPAWHLYLNNRLSKLVKHTDGTIVFNLKPGIYNIKLIYQRTTALLIGITCSILSLVCLLLYNKIWIVN